MPAGCDGCCWGFCSKRIFGEIAANALGERPLVAQQLDLGGLIGRRATGGGTKPVRILQLRGGRRVGRAVAADDQVDQYPDQMNDERPAALASPVRSVLRNRSNTT